MDDFYLNDTKREFYDNALAHVRNCEDDFWDLDDNLDKYIDLINFSRNVRTMYSRKGRNRSGYGLESYLTICYTKDVETQIKNEIEPNLRVAFEAKRDCAFTIYYKSPRVDKENEEAAPYLKYISDPNYWNIFNIKFELKGCHSEHDSFWSILSETLSKL